MLNVIKPDWRRLSAGPELNWLVAASLDWKICIYQRTPDNDPKYHERSADEIAARFWYLRPPSALLVLLNPSGPMMPLRKTEIEAYLDAPPFSTDEEMSQAILWLRPSFAAIWQRLDETTWPWDFSVKSDEDLWLIQNTILREGKTPYALCMAWLAFNEPMLIGPFG